jgi:hypothetical protein
VHRRGGARPRLPGGFLHHPVRPTR